MGDVPLDEGLGHIAAGCHDHHVGVGSKLIEEAGEVTVAHLHRLRKGTEN